MKWETQLLKWIHPPDTFQIEPDQVVIETMPHTDLWQRTYYHFQNDNAPILVMETEEPFFSFVVKTDFQPRRRFDQCGVIVYLDDQNWIKASVEYENETCAHLGSVVTNNGYSDWALCPIDAAIHTMWYRLSRRQDDFAVEFSLDGSHFSMMRICHLSNAESRIAFGLYACSPEDSSFRAVFSQMQGMECQWPAHDGQPPDASWMEQKSAKQSGLE